MREAMRVIGLGLAWTGSGEKTGEVSREACGGKREARQECSLILGRCICCRRNVSPAEFWLGAREIPGLQALDSDS